MGIEAAEGLAENLGHAVAAVGPGVDAMVYGLVAVVEAHRVVAGREHHAANAVAPRRLEHLVGADDVRAQDDLPGSFHRKAAQVHDRVNALRHPQHVAQAGAVAPHEFLARGGVRDRPDV